MSDNHKDGNYNLLKKKSKWNFCSCGCHPLLGVCSVRFWGKTETKPKISVFGKPEPKPIDFSVFGFRFLVRFLVRFSVFDSVFGFSKTKNQNQKPKPKTKTKTKTKPKPKSILTIYKYILNSHSHFLLILDFYMISFP